MDSACVCARESQVARRETHQESIYPFRKPCFPPNSRWTWLQRYGVDRAIALQSRQIFVKRMGGSFKGFRYLPPDDARPSGRHRRKISVVISTGSVRTGYVVELGRCMLESTSDRQESRDKVLRTVSVGPPGV